MHRGTVKAKDNFMKITVSGEALSRVDRQIFAASFAQQQSWVLDQLKPDSAINTIAATVHVSKPLSTSALAGSLNMLVQRHEVLRTTFDMLEGQLVQVIAPSLTIPLVMKNLQQMREAEQRVQVEHLVTEQSQQAFDLTQGPLVRVSLLQLAAEEHVLLLSMHRIVCDDWSVGVLVRDLACLYEICSSEEPSPLAPLPY